ncbi:TlpA family protein disulfide reductase [Flavobacterium rhizosphaerae]|uniref:TlpA disulfide reductase family protein n=1 Tax=Flavobacterium rhizosphaerae TaxID=3163298 RepID=A0ABW8YSA0_9FLAO
MRLLFALLFTVVSLNAQQNLATITLFDKTQPNKGFAITQSYLSQIIEFMPLGNSGSNTYRVIFNVTNGLYVLLWEDKMQPIYLEEGYKVAIEVEEGNFPENLIFRGGGALENNLLVTYSTYESSFFKKINDSKEDIEAQENLINANIEYIRDKLKDKRLNRNFVKAMDDLVTYKRRKWFEVLKQNENNLKLKGKPCPDFKYENFSGGTVSPKDWKGHYVYIDLWATWCAPCRAIHPEFEKLITEYADDNIVFVSISIDKLKDHKKWRKVLETGQHGGVQLLADKDWNSKLLRKLLVKSIPHFILLDHEGNFLDADAPRPGTPELQALLNSTLRAD